MSAHALFLAGHFKGNAAFRAARALGFRPLLLTTQALLGARWDRDALEDVFAVPTLDDRALVRNAVAYLARSRRIERVATVDDPGVDLAAYLREQLQLDGLGESAARLFRDKLAMRRRAASAGVGVPAFTSLVRDHDIAAFLRSVDPPWLLKPRGEASSKGIRRLGSASEAWAAVQALGDARVDHLIERFVPGDLFHVDSVVHRGEVLFAEAHAYARPLLEVVERGGMMVTRTVPRSSPLSASLLDQNAKILAALGLERGVAHTEILLDRGGNPFFIESAARVGGAHIPELIEATTGVNLWEAYTRLELLPDEAPPLASGPRGHGALLVTLSRHERPDLSPYQGAEVAWRLEHEPFQAGLVLRHDDSDALDALIDHLAPRFAADFGP